VCARPRGERRLRCRYGGAASTSARAAAPAVAALRTRVQHRTPRSRAAPLRSAAPPATMVALAVAPPAAQPRAALAAPRSARAHARAHRAAPRLRVVAAAADDLCKDKVSSPKDLRGVSSTLCTVNFAGADGKVLAVEMPEVCASRLRAVRPPASALRRRATQALSFGALRCAYLTLRAARLRAGHVYPQRRGGGRHRPARHLPRRHLRVRRTRLPPRGARTAPHAAPH
jgi:hypothetical protein